MDNVKNETALEPYEAPTIEDIPLHAEEQLLAGCKIPPLGGPGTGICGQGPQACQRPGTS
jgi:hypothetical protein